MTELARHIEILLLDNDCVIVPNFGGFMAHHVPATFIPEESLFMPPTRTLGFNPQLRLNDSLLAQSYVEVYDVSYPEALRKIEEDVEELRDTIRNYGSCYLHNIGNISLNDEGMYDFQPCLSGVATPNMYSLSSLEIQELSFSQETKDVFSQMEHINDESSQTKYQELNEASIGDATTHRTISLKIDTIKKFASAAAIIFFFMLISLPLGENNNRNIKLCSVDSSILYRIMPSMEINGRIPAFLSHITEVNDTIASVSCNQIEYDKKETDSSKDVLEVDNFVIVLASQVTKINADNYVKTLINNGIIDARVIETGKTRRVVCGNYTNEDEARERVNSLSKVGDYHDAWILHLK